MDFLLFFIGLIALFKGRTHTVITIITLLSSRYLQLPIHSTFAVNYLFPHNVEDVGLILYIMWFITYLRKGKITKSHPLTKYILVFYLFLLFSGIYDICIGTSVGDVIKYMRQWLLLTVVFIAPNINFSAIKQSLQQITTITVYLSVYILAIRFIGFVDVLDLNSIEGRGIKPPSYSMIGSLLVFANPWNYSNNKKLIYLTLLVLPILLSLKVTYSVTVVGLISLYILTKSSTNLAKRSAMLMGILIGTVIFISSANNFMERVNEMITNLSSQSLGNIESEDNFTYRLAHSNERLQYILETPAKAVRGLGFVTEENYKENAFIVGLWSRSKEKIVQLDTGDIAWSILFLRLGLLGLAVYLSIYFKLTSLMFKNRKISPIYGVYATTFIVFLTFTSLGNTIITMGEFFFIPLLLTDYSKLKNENSTLNMVI